MKSLKLFLVTVLMLLYLGISAQELATKPEHERADRHDVESFAQQVTDMVAQDYTSFTIEYSTGSNGQLTSQAIYLVKTVQVKDVDGKSEDVDIEVRAFNPNPIKNGLFKKMSKWFKPDVAFVGENKDLKFTDKQMRTILKALKPEFKLMEIEILESRKDYRPIE